MKIFSRFITIVTLSMTFTWVSFNAAAQTLERQITGTAGSWVNTPIQIDYTVGEPVIETITSGNIILTQGFHQPYGIISGNNVFPYLIIFPNPTPGDAQARFILTSPARLTISIYNTIGQLMAAEEINYTTGEMQYIIKSKKLIPGVYVIQFAMNDGSGKVSKQLIKME